MKSNSYRLERISMVGHQLLQAINDQSITPDDLLNNIETQWMITTPLYNIGEQVNCLSPDFTDSHPDIPWAQIAGLRHRLIHDYEGTNWNIISSVIFEELEPFIKQIDDLIIKH